MSTLSLDLRGVSANHALPTEAPAKGAGVSLLIHTALISTLVLIPLLQSANPPEVAHAMSAPLARPITVTLPPAPGPVRPAPRRTASSRPALAAALTPTTPTLTPDSLNRASSLDLDVGPARLADIGEIGDPNSRDAVGGDCPLGSLCGPALQPIAEPPKTVRVGGVIKEPRLIESRAPVYPPIAQNAGVAGKVVLEAHVGEDGGIREVRITEGNPLFNEAALASVRSRRYEPLLLNGVRTDFLVTITVAFNFRR